MATFQCGIGCGRFDAFWCRIGCGRLNDGLVLHHFHPSGSSGLCAFQAHLAARKCFGCRLLALGRVQNGCNLLRPWQPDEQFFRWKLPCLQARNFQRWRPMPQDPVERQIRLWNVEYKQGRWRSLDKNWIISKVLWSPMVMKWSTNLRSGWIL